MEAAQRLEITKVNSILAVQRGAPGATMNSVSRKQWSASRRSGNPSGYFRRNNYHRHSGNALKGNKGGTDHSYIRYLKQVKMILWYQKNQ